MNVVVPAFRSDCPAILALRKEGVPHQMWQIDHEYSYSEMFIELWKEGEDFISLEHDVVPWPGALQELWNCGNPRWCSYKYPLAPNVLQPALGCIKVSSLVIEAYPLLWKLWDNRKWNELDGIVCTALEAVTGSTHIHTPPLAHVKL